MFHELAPGNFEKTKKKKIVNANHKDDAGFYALKPYHYQASLSGGEQVLHKYFILVTLLFCMRFLKKCENEGCQQEFNVLKDNTGRDENGELKAICPWCRCRNNLSIQEKKSLLIEFLSG